MITVQRQDVLVPWLCERIGYVPGAHMTCIGSISSDGLTLRGVVGYDGYNGASVQMHMAGEGHWIDKSMLWAAFDYAFSELGCNVVFGLVPSGNTVALRINKRLGFETVAEIEGGHPDGALIFQMMRREHCKWLVPRRTH